MEEKNQQPEPTVIRRRFRGVVVSNATDKTIIVLVERKRRHPLYGKLFTRSRKFHVHDEKNAYVVGNTVEFVECRPYSKLKRWRALYKNEDNATEKTV